MKLYSTECRSGTALDKFWSVKHIVQNLGREQLSCKILACGTYSAEKMVVLENIRLFNLKIVQNIIQRRFNDTFTRSLEPGIPEQKQSNSSLNVRNLVSQPYSTTGNIIVLYILVF